MAGRNVIAPEGLSFAVLRDAIEQVSEFHIVELRERRRSRTWLTVRRKGGAAAKRGKREVAYKPAVSRWIIHDEWITVILITAWSAGQRRKQRIVCDWAS